MMYDYPVSIIMMINENFCVMSSFDPQILGYIPVEHIPKYLKKLHPGMSLSHCQFASLVPGYVHDLEWNFYDEPHRQYVHHTYDDMYKVMMGKYFSVNIVRWKTLPIFFQVANAKISDGLFYQSMNILGILCVHQVVRFIQQEEHKVLLDIHWWTASHWLFKWMHYPFNKKLLQLQRKQNYEDNTEIRQRRTNLRQNGFSFITDNPDFMNSNTLTNKVRMPVIEKEFLIELHPYELNKIHRIQCGPMELLFNYKADNTVELWPGVCPHEGAFIGEKNICNGVAVCPWHGRTFTKVTLNDKKRHWRFLNVNVLFTGNCLKISQEKDSYMTSKADNNQPITCQIV